MIPSQPTVVEIPNEFNMEHFRKFAGLYNALITTERANSITIYYYNNQGVVSLEQLCDYTEEEHNTVLTSWDDYSDDFKDVQLIFDIIKDSNFTQNFTKHMMSVLNNIYYKLKTQYGWTIILPELKSFPFVVATQSNNKNKTINIKIKLPKQVNYINIPINISKNKS